MATRFARDSTNGKTCARKFSSTPTASCAISGANRRSATCWAGAGGAQVLRPPAPQRAGTPARTSPLDDALPTVADPASGRERTAREAGEILTRALAVLAADDRLVLTLLELEDLPVREVAGPDRLERNQRPHPAPTAHAPL